MNIQFNNINKQYFDKQSSKQYNYFKPLCADSFELNFGAKNMSEDFNKDLEKMKTSEKLINCPVAYIIPLISACFEEKIDNKKFYNDLTAKTKDAQFYFSHMSKEDRTESQKVFYEEFKLADNIYKTAKSNLNTDLNTLKTNLKQLISEYVKD